MDFGGFGRNSGPNTGPRAQSPFLFPRQPSPSPPRPISPRSNEPSLRWGDAQASPFKDHGAYTYQRPPGLLPQAASSISKNASFAKTAEVQNNERTHSTYSQSEVSNNYRSVMERDKSYSVPYRGRSPPLDFQTNLYVGGQHPHNEEIQQRPLSSSSWDNQSNASRSVVITRGPNQSRPIFPTKYADGPLPKRTRSPTLTPTGGISSENTVSHSDGHKRSLIDYRDLDAPEAMPSLPLGFESSLPSRNSSQPFAGNERASDLRSQSQSSTFGQTNSSEVAMDRPVHFPALKRTKIPIRSSSDQILEKNLDPSQEIERELLAKEKRLARFKDELSQPVQSHSTVRNQEVPAKRQQLSMPERQKNSEDPTTDRMGDSADGNASSEYEGLTSSASIVGLCPDMCPESERAERERKGDLDQYERLDGVRNLTSEYLAVKKYTRAAEREAELIRPMPILKKTLEYLLNLLDEPYDDRFLGLYNFLWDRMRAIRVDLRMQHIFNVEAISMLEQMIRLHIIAMHELCEYTKGEGFSEGFDAHLNIEQMNKTSVELFQLYDDHRKKGIHVPSEREFRGYYALLKLDKHPGYKVEPTELSLDLAKMTPEMRQTQEVLFARDVARACSTGNFIAFFRLARKASYLQACLMHAHFSKLRTQALAALHCGLQINQGIPITLVAKWLGMEEEDIGNLLEYYGFSVKDFEEPYMVKENAFINVDNDFPVKRSKLVNSKKSRMIVGDVSFPSHTELYAREEVKEFLLKKDSEQVPTPVQPVLSVSTTQVHDEEMNDLGPILSPRGSMQKNIDNASIALTTPEKEMVGHGFQLAPASPLVLDFSNRSSEQSTADFAHKSKFQPIFRNSFGRSRHEMEETSSIALETPQENRYPDMSLDSVVHTPLPQPMFSEDLEDEEQTGIMEEDKSDEVTTSYYDQEVEEAKFKLILRIWRRRAANKRELRERKKLTANAALSLLSMGPPIQQFEVQSCSFDTFNIDHIMSERQEIRERSWSVLNPSQVVAPKVVEINGDAKCLCWKLVLFSLHEDNMKLHNEAAISSPNSWLLSKLMPANNHGDSNLLVSSRDLAIWSAWVPSQSGVDLTCCLSVIKSVAFEDQNKAITGANAVIFSLSEYTPIELQRKRLHDFVMLLPSGSRLPLLILSGSGKDESNPSNIAKALGLDEIDKSRVIIFCITSLKDGDKKKPDGFLSDERLREGLEWLASESPPQIFVKGLKTRDLVLSHLNPTLEILDETNNHRVGPNNCILSFNEALDRAIKKVGDAADANPTNWPCPEIGFLDESSEEYLAANWYLPGIGWSLSSKIEVKIRALSDSKLPPLEDDLRWLSRGSNSSDDIENQKSRLEKCLVDYLTKTSRMMGLALAQKEAGILLQKFTGLELHNNSYYIVPNWVSIFRRIFSWRLMNLNSDEVSSTYVLEQDYFPNLSSEGFDNSESIITFCPQIVHHPSLDELVEVGSKPNPGFEFNFLENEAFQPLLPTTSDGENGILMENEETSSANGRLIGYDHSSMEENHDSRMIGVTKGSKETDRLSELLEKCNIVQNLIDEKLSIYF